MICPKCQNEIKDDSIFCSQCGFNLNDKVERNEEPKRRRKGLEIAFAIISIIVFSFALIFSWGSTYDIQASGSNYQAVFEASFGTNYFLNLGWKQFSSSISKGEISNAITFIFTFITYLLAVISIYILSIKGIIKAIRFLSKKEENDYSTNTIAIFLIFFAYIAFMNLIKYMLVPSKINYTYYYSSASWGNVLGSIFIWGAATLLMIKTIIYAKKEKGINNMISKILLCVSVIITAITTFNIMNNSFEVNGLSYSLFEILFSFKNASIYSTDKAIYQLIPVFVLLFSVIFGILSFVTVSLYVTEKIKNKKLPIIAIISFGVTLLVGLILINPMLTKVYGDTPRSYIGNALISDFVAIIVSIGLIITATNVEKQ